MTTFIQSPTINCNYTAASYLALYTYVRTPGTIDKNTASSHRLSGRPGSSSSYPVYLVIMGKREEERGLATCYIESISLLLLNSSLPLSISGELFRPELRSSQTSSLSLSCSLRLCSSSSARPTLVCLCFSLSSPFFLVLCVRCKNLSWFPPEGFPSIRLLPPALLSAGCLLPVSPSFC